MRTLAYIILPLLFFACINENTLHSAFPTHNLHANSAKVWVLSKSSNSDEYTLPELRAYRKCFIFYSNEIFREQELIHLGSEIGTVGRYTIENSHKSDFYLTLNYQDSEPAYFKIITIKNDFLKLQNIDGDQAVWEFKTLNPPEL